MTIQEILQHYWKHNHFRPLQEEIIQSVLLGRDTLALLPTGGGKSVCFQVPALAKEGICIVISPLIALMKDQVENLVIKGIDAVSITSGMSKREVDIALDNCIYGNVKFLYLSPERLLSELVQERISYMKVNLIAVDEAHCISQWGYDFRPPYLHIADLRKIHPDVPVLALTATATADVRIDIQEKLDFKQPNIFTKSFERKNISYVVQHQENKMQRLLAVVKGVNGSGIIYVRSRKETFEVAQTLNQYGYSADYYHAGLEAAMRAKKQESWKSGQVRIMVATNAFGMGIDKPDVRFVIHKDLPESPEAYYQEAGRAGRDEQKAYAVLLYNHTDRYKLEHKFEMSFPTVDEIKKVYHSLGTYYQLAYGAGAGISFDLDIADFCATYQLEPIKTLNSLKFLERNEYVSFTESVFLPSRYRFLVGNEDLYNFQIQHIGWDPFIKTLLRSYGGAFDNYVPIREFDLAKRMNTSTQKVIEGLNQLQHMEVLNYIPQTDQPQVTYLSARHEVKDVVIDRQYIEQRKRVFRLKMEAVFHYAETQRCRSQMLLNYFDEPNARKCGVCDVCREEKRTENANDTSDLITNQIVNLLGNHALALDDLVNSIVSGNEKERISLIRVLLDAGRIKSDGERFYL